MIKKSKVLYIILIVLGAVALAAGILLRPYIDNDRFAGFLTGFGGSLFVLGIALLLWTIINPKAAMRQAIAKKDERFATARGRAALATVLIAIFALAILIAVLLFLNYYALAMLAFCILMVQSVVFLVFLLYYNQKM